MTIDERLEELDGSTKVDAAQVAALAAALLRARRIQGVVDAQADDEGLWFVTTTASEAYLQQGLRTLHAFIESAFTDTELEEALK